MTELTSSEEIHEGVAEARKEGKFLLGALLVGVDIEKLLADYQSTLGQYALKASPRADGSTLRSISLTHRPNASDPLYDGNNTQYDPATNRKLFLESDFTVFNEGFRKTAFYNLYKALPFRVGRMRLNLLPALTVFNMHRDSAPRGHIALITNPDCFLASGDGQAVHIPPDGNVYLFDTTLPHTAFNSSRLDRLHLTMSLADEEL